MQTMETISGRDLAGYASSRLELWSSLVGSELTHTEYGAGRILSVEQRPDYIPLIRIEFDDAVHVFNSDSFCYGTMTVAVDALFAKIVSEWAEREAAENAAEELQAQARAELERPYRELAEKYNVSFAELWDRQRSSALPLWGILKKLEGREKLDLQDIRWLEVEQQYRLLATAHFRDYKRDGDLWSLVKTCTYLRKAQLPEKVVEVTRAITPAMDRDRKALSAIWTTRGGALRDLNELDDAIQCAEHAISLSPESFHPHNLMGAILYQKGHFAQGDWHFGEAVRLGATLRSAELEIKGALAKSTGDARDALIQYLIAKDPNAYAWARNYAEQV